MIFNKIIIKKIRTIILLYLFLTPSAIAQSPNYVKSQNVVSASWIRSHITTNPVTPSWIKAYLKKHEPRLLLTAKRERQLKQKIKEDKLVRTYYDYLHHYADEICTKPVLKIKLIGRRSPSAGKAALRIGVLGLLYRIERNEKYLDRLNKILNVVSHFSAWDSIQFLERATMTYAMAIGLDWTGKWLPDNTIKSARSAIKKNLLDALHENRWWVDAANNWNQVCHSGLSAGALVIADQDPELAAKIIGRAIRDLPFELAEYSPDGAYPEGPSYWGYGTSFNIMIDCFFQSALGTDFNLPDAPGFIKSATYRMEVVGPSGKSFNYSDASTEGLDLSTRGDLMWFAQQTGSSLYLNKKKILALLQKAMKQHRNPPMFSPLQLIWLSKFKKRKSATLPVYWKGEGYNPIAIFRAKKDKQTGFWLGVKGGSASANHGNMDVGSFVFELNGVRWSIDPGTQSYHQLEINKNIGQALWDESQGSPRWSLLSKGNCFHSTLTVNGARHNVNGFAPIIKFNVDSSPQIVSLDLSKIFKGQLKRDIRTFKKINDETLQIEDDFVPSDSTKKITWQMMTQAAVTTTKHGAILKQDGKKLILKIIQPHNLNVSVISLNPPPLAYDKRITNFKKIEITVPYYMIDPQPGKIIVELKGN